MVEESRSKGPPGGRSILGKERGSESRHFLLSRFGAQRSAFF